MNFHDLPSARKGAIGERIVDEYLLARGIVPYRPIADAAHPFDRLCASRDKKRLFVAEIKTKPRREAYPDTGIDYRHFREYLQISMTYGMDVYVYFVDEVLRSIYGGELIGRLSQPRQEMVRGRNCLYPMKEGSIIYFPLSVMETIAELSGDECAQLAALRQSSFTPKTRNLF